MNDALRRSAVAVIGTGTMGKGIVQLLAQSDAVDSICWMGRTPSSADQAMSALAGEWARLVRKGRLEQAFVDQCIEKIQLVCSYAELGNKTLIIEAVAENIEVKKEIFKALEPVSSSETLLASNTSSLSVTEIASVCRYPENVIGLHFFNPAPVMKLVEIIVGLATSEVTIERGVAFSKLLGKEPVLVQEAPGFIVNRMLIPMINEAIGILAEGVASAEEIDKAMRFGANHPIGPLALADLIGNDVNLSIMETLHQETGDPKYRAHALLRKMVRANRLGRKTGHGFHKY